MGVLSSNARREPFYRCVGQPRSALDMIIAAIAEANDCIVATGNERHFRSVVAYINPLKACS